MDLNTHEEPERGRTLYVVTLYASELPMALAVPALAELEGVSVFRSRSVEDGRELFRLHLGFFDADVRALEVLALMRPHFPAARISDLPRTSLSSLDDTMNTAFRVIRGPARADDEREPRAPRAAASRALPAPSGPPGGSDPVRYSVELEVGAAPIDPAAVAPLEVFKAFNLYTVQTAGPDGREHRLRLGFFRDLDGARQVADYVRSDYPQASAVPVSEREHTRVVDLTHERKQNAASARVRRLEPPRAPRGAAPPAPSAPHSGGEVIYAKFSARELAGGPPEPELDEED